MRLAMATKRKTPTLKKTEQPEQPIVVAAEEVTVKDMTSSKKPFKFTQLTFILPVSVLLLVILGGGGYYIYTAKQNTKAPVNESETLVEKVGKLIELPQEEAPTLATVSDVTKLRGQEFFSHAQNGDKVLVYQQAKKAILYRPSSNKIVNVGPVALNTTATPAPEVAGAASNAATLTPSPTSAETVKVTLFNGTKTNGLTKRAEKELTDKGVLIEVVARGNAKEDHVKTLVVVLSGTVEQGKAIAEVIGGEIGEFPKGEEKPQADILVILGQDYAER